MTSRVRVLGSIHHAAQGQNLFRQVTELKQSNSAKSDKTGEQQRYDKR